MGVMVGAYYGYFVLFLLLLLTGKVPPVFKWTKWRIPLLGEEKLAIRIYYGVEDPVGAHETYRREVLGRVSAALPLLILALGGDRMLLVSAIPMGVWAYRFGYLKMKRTITKRQVDFHRRYPAFLNNLRLYLQSGLTLENSLEEYFRKERDCYYLEYLHSSLQRIRRGKSRREAFIEVIHHTRMREMIHLMNYFLQHIELGTEDLAYLSHLSEEAWKIKKETVKRLAEEASAKMVLPMMLIFIAVLLLIIVPSLFAVLGTNGIL